ncbi:Ser/Thr protein kinase RdoA involved in Cpx stress response, MazF antagonist [Propionibacterium cyclohexanicum]|uniref:Ser/Thr protein kinase RdoA involved in Cpx stress response, MazF antagonist n=1 Tax=Propionibacterium cyclohexanicum TaxID=64702 RepID=A0A1H9Q171_9ACTN|nr:phosphotransferase [Propionibacterium cyclohexanicum]SER53815.1 Ser/Thr protein kinase RdoA involved in Cpx stress response, MazF antagonist [Propionibacterium cyclohexanicum]
MSIATQASQLPTSPVRFDIEPQPTIAALVRAACQAWGLTDTTAEFIKYRENWVFKLTSGGDQFALRIHRPGYQSRASIQCEMAMLTALGREGLPVPRPRANGRDELVLSLRGDDSRSYQLDIQEWIADTKPLGEVTQLFLGGPVPEPATFEAIGELAGRTHSALARAVAEGRVDATARPSWDRDALVGPHPLWGDPRRLLDDDADRRVIDRAMRRISERLEALGQGEEDFGLIHGDLTPENLLVREGSLILIDFDDAGTGWHLFDLATAVVFLTARPDFVRYEQALLGGYERVRPLSQQALASWPDVLLARALTYLGWAADRRGDEAAEFLHDHFMAHVVQRARDYLSVPQAQPRG